MEAKRRPTTEPDAVRLRGWIDVAVGLTLFAIGAIVLTVTHDSFGSASSSSLAIYGVIVVGALTAVRGIWRLVVSRATTGPVPLDFGARGGYKVFVAWRYLMVSDRKVTRATLWGLAAGVTSLIALRLIGSYLVADPLDTDPLLLAEQLAAVFTGGVLLWGVLRHSRPAIITFLFGLVFLAIAIGAMHLVSTGTVPFVRLNPDQTQMALQALTVVRIFGALLAGLALFFGYLRAYFTFFTTVPIGGVWIGTAALVMVLAVMSGFESDLRDKILGSNAHVQIARDDGDFVEWREVEAQIARMPEVVASAPFAISEVVIAANNTGMNVIIKGIDPKTIGKVTDLVSDLEDREAIHRLDPIIDDTHDLQVPQPPRTPGSGDVIDPPPEDMPTPGEPIDFSGPRGEAGSADPRGSDARGGSADPAGTGGRGGSADPGGTGGRGGSADPGGTGGRGARGGGAAGGDPDRVEAPSAFGGDASSLIDLDPLERPERWVPPPARLRERGALDPPPSDLLTTDESPADFSRADYAPESVVRVIDIPFDTPSVSRRTQSLPGILVGRELVKQTHLYPGEEVRVVSPLSDPANPDATGTPIPFNRDFRVAGTFFTGMYEYDLKYVYVTLDALQDFLDRGDAVDGIEIRVRNPDETDAFVAKLQATFGPRYRVQDWKELNRSLFSALKLEKIAMFLVLGIVIMVASFSIVGNLIMVVQAKVRQISLLKTLGASDVGVLQLFAIQGLTIGLIGTVLGVGTGLLACWAGMKYGVPISAEVYYINKLPIHIDPMSVLAAASAGILISIAATLYPAVIAARIRPASGLRH
jgi:lipoprotein-releasing system permease protein